MNERAQKTIANPGSLQKALWSMRENNDALGFRAMRFRQLTQDGYHPDLLRVCEELVLNPNAFAAMEKAVKTYSGFLTLEDYVAVWGAEWGFSEQAVEHAKDSAETLDRLVEYRRWVADNEARDG